MSVFRRLFGGLEPEHREAVASVLGRAPNSADSSPVKPARRAASERRVATRNMDELIGMCRMVLSDGIVEDHKARFLLDWIEKNYHAAKEWPGSILYPRLAAAMKDDHLDPAEESELLEVPGKVAAGPPRGGKRRQSVAQFRLMIRRRTLSLKNTVSL